MAWPITLKRKNAFFQIFLQKKTISSYHPTQDKTGLAAGTVLINRELNPCSMKHLGVQTASPLRMECQSVQRLPYEICVLGDPGADSGHKRKSKRAEKYDTKKSKERRSLLFFVPYFSARLDFLLSPLSAPGSPRMQICCTYILRWKNEKRVKEQSLLSKGVMP